jgi:hypothetical protein
MYQEEGRAPVVVLAESDGNTGLSITGAIETLVHNVWQTLDRPKEIVWIEHYRISLGKHEALDTFAVVEFSLTTSGHIVDPEWKPIEISCVEEIIGCALE